MYIFKKKILLFIFPHPFLGNYILPGDIFPQVLKQH